MSKLDLTDQVQMCEAGVDAKPFNLFAKLLTAISKEIFTRWTDGQFDVSLTTLESKQMNHYFHELCISLTNYVFVVKILYGAFNTIQFLNENIIKEYFISPVNICQFLLLYCRQFCKRENKNNLVMH